MNDTSYLASRGKNGQGAEATVGLHAIPAEMTLVFELAARIGQAKHLVVLMKHVCHGSIIVKKTIIDAIRARAATIGRRRGLVSRSSTPTRRSGFKRD